MKDDEAGRPARVALVREVIEAAQVIDVHTHLFPAQLGALCLSGPDELLTYHALVEEFLRSEGAAPAAFLASPKARQAELVWDALFVRSTPISEASSGVAAIWSAFGLDPRAPDLREARAFFAAQDPEAHVDRVLAMAGVSEVVMTNDPFDPAESAAWLAGPRSDPRFRAALRLDLLLNEWPRASSVLAGRGIPVATDLGGKSIDEVRRFLDEWIARLSPAYLAASLPADFHWQKTSARHRLLTGAVLPVCRERGMPLALMLGVRRQVNPRLGLAGDGLGRANLHTLERFAAEFPENHFLVTALSREDQHELCVVARKFSNVLPFGCWWFLDSASIVAEITRERLELLGLSFIPQHSDARVLEQLVYKWGHARRAIGEALAASYAQVEAAGRPVSRADVDRDVARLLTGNFRRWTERA